MFEQAIILFFLIIFTGMTLFLYIWKAKKEINYKGDERWQLIQIKSNTTANYSNNLLILVLFIAEMVELFSNIQIVLTLNRVLTFGILFVGLRNTLELLSLLYFDKQL